MLACWHCFGVVNPCGFGILSLKGLFIVPLVPYGIFSGGVYAC